MVLLIYGYNAHIVIVQQGIGVVCGKLSDSIQANLEQRDCQHNWFWDVEKNGRHGVTYICTGKTWIRLMRQRLHVLRKGGGKSEG